MVKIVIVGGGPAGLMVAHQLVRANVKADITLLDANKAVGRKFLVAGHGGFNLSNNRELDEFIKEYDHPFIQNAVRQFTNNDTIQWLNEIGIETFIGSSGKIFPKMGIKPIQVLQAWLDYLIKGGIKILTNHKVVGFNTNCVQAQFGSDLVDFSYNHLVFGLGGGSWSSTGANDKWMKIFQSKGVSVSPFQPSNAGIELDNWNASLAGCVLKNTQISIGSKCAFGDVELTNYGLEGAPVYALSGSIREGNRSLYLNFKPSLTTDVITQRYKNFKGSKSEFLKSLKLSKEVVTLIKHYSSKEQFNDDTFFIKLIHGFLMPVVGLRPLDEAISTVGGVNMDEIDENFKCKVHDNVYFIGEMLNWDAPTGGYLLQACFASGFVCAKNLINQCGAN